MTTTTTTTSKPRDLDTIATRYPRLVRALKWTACLSTGEAAATIRDQRDGHSYGCEAVCHFGRGTTSPVENAIRRAIGCREIARRYS